MEQAQNKLYVGNLSYDVTGDQLKELFAQAGEVESAQIISDRETGRSKGFGFVTMKDKDGVVAAIKKFNGYTLGERALTVNEARPREERPAGGGFRGNGGGGYNRGGGNNWGN